MCCIMYILFLQSRHYARKRYTIVKNMYTRCCLFFRCSNRGNIIILEFIIIAMYGNIIYYTDRGASNIDNIRI